MPTQTPLMDKRRLRPVRSGYLPRGLSPRLAELSCKFAPETGKEIPCGGRLFRRYRIHLYIESNHANWANDEENPAIGRP
jgi:hypothetical protein